MIITEKKLDEIDKKIIEHIKNGLLYKEISSREKITVPAIKYRIRVMKKEFKCSTVPALIHKISE